MSWLWEAEPAEEVASRDSGARGKAHWYGYPDGCQASGWLVHAWRNADGSYWWRFCGVPIFQAQGPCRTLAECAEQYLVRDAAKRLGAAR